MTHEQKGALDWQNRNLPKFIDAKADACAVVSGFYNITHVKYRGGFDAVFISGVEPIGVFETLDTAKRVYEQHQVGAPKAA
jgi:hypothetical protein